MLDKAPYTLPELNLPPDPCGFAPVVDERPAELSRALATGQAQKLELEKAPAAATSDGQQWV